MEPLQLALVLHFHQPVGNLGPVFEEAFDRCYDPLLASLEEAEELNFTLHFSGSLLEWLQTQRPAYLDRLRELTAAGRVEWLSGGFYEPILAAIPPADRLGQLLMMRRWLEDNLGCSPAGCWLAERVWEPSLASTLAEAGLDYTLVDDHLIRRAGYETGRERAPYVVEDGGRLIRVLPISERLRYLVPFRPLAELETELEETRERGGRFLVYGDDAEKFGLWPETHELVFERGWLREAWQALAGAGARVRTCRAGDLLHRCGPPEPAFIPAGSYREMEEWASPVTGITLAEFREELERGEKGVERERARAAYLAGGAWRHFLVRYPEGRRLHGRVCAASRLVRRTGPAAEEALRHLYRAQCNCAYWHGTFGGIYLTHLRDGLYRNLLRAEQIALSARDRNRTAPGREAEDFDLDGCRELALTRGPIRALVKPDQGGRLYELSHLEAAWNPLLALSRREEAYHRQLDEEKRALLAASLDSSPRDCLLDRIVAGPPAPGEGGEEAPATLRDLSRRPYEESWQGDILVLSTTLGPGEGAPRLVKRLEPTPRGLRVVYGVTGGAGGDPPEWLAVDFCLGPGNRGGDSPILAGGEERSGAAPFTLAAPEEFTVKEITRGDFRFHQEGAQVLLFTPLWGIARDEEGEGRRLQGLCLTLFAPLARLADGRGEMAVDLHPEPWT